MRRKNRTHKKYQNTGRITLRGRNIGVSGEERSQKGTRKRVRRGQMVQKMILRMHTIRSPPSRVINPDIVIAIAIFITIEKLITRGAARSFANIRTIRWAGYEIVLRSLITVRMNQSDLNGLQSIGMAMSTVKDFPIQRFNPILNGLLPGISPMLQYFLHDKSEEINQTL